MLYTQGGVARFYKGFWPALVQGPLLRSCDTATNAGVLTFFEQAEEMPIFVKTAFASVSAASLRMFWESQFSKFASGIAVGSLGFGIASASAASVSILWVTDDTF